MRFKRCVSYATSPVKRSTPPALIRNSIMVLFIHQFTTLAKMMPNRPMNRMLPNLDKSTLVVYPAMAMMAKVPAAMANTWAKLPREYAKKMPPRLTPIVPAKARKHRANVVTLSFCNPKFITSKKAKGANMTSQKPMPCIKLRYHPLVAA